MGGGVSGDLEMEAGGSGFRDEAGGSGEVEMEAGGSGDLGVEVGTLLARVLT